MERLGLSEGGYMLVTAHRAENVDRPERLDGILEGLNRVAQRFDTRVICSVHPRTRSRIEGGGTQVEPDARVEFYEPFGFFDFVRLERHAACAITDSGTVQEECCIFGVPTVTIRQTTERPETVDCGSNVVCGLKPDRIEDAVAVMTTLPSRWKCPEGYMADDVSDIVVKFLLGGKWDVY
jgi:UDP-N-acetylglucosamine 2-epimerase (non-hydrolysing)